MFTTGSEYLGAIKGKLMKEKQHGYGTWVSSDKLTTKTGWFDNSEFEDGERYNT